MPRLFTFLILISTLAGCKPSVSAPQASNSAEIRRRLDTSFTFNIEGVSSEGTEAIVKYKGGKIAECVIKIYGCAGRTELFYSFFEKRIDVAEKRYAYHQSIENVKSASDMSLEDSSHYSINYDGKPVGRIPEKRLDVFDELKNSVPFELSQ